MIENVFACIIKHLKRHLWFMFLLKITTCIWYDIFFLVLERSKEQNCYNFTRTGKTSLSVIKQ
jgi:hypothetical protein